MSYAIIRNEKLTRVQAMGAYKHNERKTRNHSNKNINSTKTELNYYLKKNELSYIKEFDKIKEKYDLKGQIRSNSNIMCEMVFTSDQKFFDKIGYEESKRYFEESYKFICEYKNLGEQNIISAVVHMDEDTPHMHLLFIPVIHTTDKQGNKIDKVCCRDFWKGKNSYRDLQNAYFKHISGKGFKLERGELVEVTNREHYSVQEYKRITNFENTKELLNSIKLELPETPDIKDFQKIMLNRDEKIKNKIIKPKDELIKKLYNENISLYKELSKQTTIIDKSEKFEKEKFKLETENRNLRFNLNMFQQEVEKTAKAIDVEYENKIKDLETKYKSKIDNLEYENSKLNKIIDKFKTNFKKFMKWICNKFSYPCEDDLIRDFNEETYSNIDFEQQLDVKQFEQDYEDEIDFDIY
ncbi:plasmid recombination enzyme [Clostridium sp. CAG:356]|nr:plasmid recombination enzyme [Clostridium sp. CAG:356]